MSLPFQLTICRVGDVNRLLKEQVFDAIISIKDPSGSSWGETKRRKRHRQLSRRCAAVLCLDFEDTEFVFPDIVRGIAAFGRGLPEGARVLVHCMAGISRSTAAAIIILRARGVAHSDALAEVLRVRPVAVPNAAMLRLYAEQNEIAPSGGGEVVPSDEPMVVVAEQSQQ